MNAYGPSWHAAASAVAAILVFVWPAVAGLHPSPCAATLHTFTNISSVLLNRYDTGAATGSAAGEAAAEGKGRGGAAGAGGDDHPVDVCVVGGETPRSNGSADVRSTEGWRRRESHPREEARTATHHDNARQRSCPSAQQQPQQRSPGDAMPIFKWSLI